MLNPGRGRRIGAAFVIAIACAAFAPAVAGADTVTFGPNNTHFQGTTGDLKTGTIRLIVTWDGASHLTPGTQVVVSGTGPDSDWQIADTVINVPVTWGVGGRIEADATVNFQSHRPAGNLDQGLTFTAETYACALGGTGCLTGPGTVTSRISVFPKPTPAPSVDAGVNDANVSWGPSPDHDLIHEYALVRFRRNPPPAAQSRIVFLPKAQMSFNDSPLDANSEYCYRIQPVYRGERGTVASQIFTEVCEFTGQHPDAPATGVSGPALDGDGQVDLTWGASPTPDVTYEIEHRDADDSDWSPLASNVSGTSFTADEDEGTWAYRVRATTAQRGLSAWVESPDRVKVDLTAPSAPQATTDPADPADASGGWFLDSVTVSFDGSTDPDLLDGSAGSGVGSYSAAQTFDTDGEHTATGTATDVAGHESDAATKTVKVDASAPTVAIQCPADPVLLGSDASAGWSAEDGQSGLATPASGSVDLDTDTAGSHTATAPAPVDNVGHTGDEDTCTYEVNTPPAAPGAPAGPALTRDGSFDVTWDAAQDADGDTVAYWIQQRDADDADWSAAAAADAPQYDAHVEDGTWSFRVKAVDGRGGASDWVESTSQTLVDGTAPSAPSAVTDPANAFTGGWFKDTVTVSWTGSEDPALPDGSPGSDGLTYSDPHTFATEGEHTDSGTATDAAGNESEASTTTVKVDRTKPHVEITCPADRVVAGSDASATWTASDGESGLATPDSGSVALDTAEPGTKTATAPTARDVVGHESDAATCEYEVVPPNTAPGAPGAPNGPGLVRGGSFEVSWTPATDPDEGDTATYGVQKRDGDDGDWSALADGLTEPRVDAELADGTWTFRVKAVDSEGAESDWVESSSHTVVDGGKPTAPAATTEPAGPADASGGWFKDSVEVRFGGSSDPALQDGTAGSGVDSYRGGRTFDTDGEHTATGTAVDRAGNESDATTKTVKVDASAPSSEIACPSDELIVGQPGAKANWTASDGESGLATPASGSVALNTATAGVKTATAPDASDNVGHTGDGATCQYEVRYRFAGGVAPVEGSNVINVGRRGKTYPVRWRLLRWNGSLISDAEGTALARQMSASDTKVACSSFLSSNEDGLEEETGLPSPSLRYDTRENWFVYSYRAPSVGCYTLDIRRADGLNTKRWRFLFLP